MKSHVSEKIDKKSFTANKAAMPQSKVDFVITEPDSTVVDIIFEDVELTEAKGGEEFNVDAFVEVTLVCDEIHDVLAVLEDTFVTKTVIDVTAEVLVEVLVEVQNDVLYSTSKQVTVIVGTIASAVVTY
jgi:hypothetical protein